MPSILYPSFRNIVTGSYIERLKRELYHKGSFDPQDIGYAIG
jgi:hypothetical protein